MTGLGSSPSADLRAAAAELQAAVSVEAACQEMIDHDPPLMRVVAIARGGKKRYGLTPAGVEVVNKLLSTNPNGEEQ